MVWSKSKLFFVCLLCCFLGQGMAAQEPVDSTVWQNLREAHVYDESAQAPVERVKASPAPFGLGVWWDMVKVFLLILLIIGLAILIIKLISGKQPKNRKVRPIEGGGLPTALSPVNDLEAALQAYLARGDYRQAIGIWYQLALKRLIAKEIVRGEKDKTNWEYVAELKTNPLAPPFRELTRYHERVWYGAELITAEKYQHRLPDFQSFISSVG